MTWFWRVLDGSTGEKRKKGHMEEREQMRNVEGTTARETAKPKKGPLSKKLIEIGKKSPLLSQRSGGLPKDGLPDKGGQGGDSKYTQGQTFTGHR